MSESVIKNEIYRSLELKYENEIHLEKKDHSLNNNIIINIIKNDEKIKEEKNNVNTINYNCFLKSLQYGC
jgi:hypothetical protein